MVRRVLAGVVVATAFGAVGPATAGELPILRSAKVVNRFVVLELSVGDVRPVRFTAATRRRVGPEGALLRKNVRLREPIQLPPSASAVVRWRSRKALRPGVYFVQVTAIESGGVTDCPKFFPTCLDRWSNVRRVVVRRSS
jgi:hypothetical protein